MSRPRPGSDMVGTRSLSRGQMRCAGTSDLTGTSGADPRLVFVRSCGEEGPGVNRLTFCAECSHLLPLFGGSPAAALADVTMHGYDIEGSLAYLDL